MPDIESFRRYSDDPELQDQIAANLADCEAAGLRLVRHSRVGGVWDATWEEYNDSRVLVADERTKRTLVDLTEAEFSTLSYWALQWEPADGYFD